MSERAPKLYLQDILEAIVKIGKFCRGLSFEDFCKDEKTIDAVIRNLEIIGEAARNVPEEFTEKHQDIPWRSIISMRNKVLHEYFGIDYEILWKTVSEDLPELKKKIMAIA